MTTKDYSTKQEKAIANYLNWYTVKASGATAFDKGDIKSDDWIEYSNKIQRNIDELIERNLIERIGENSYSKTNS